MATADLKLVYGGGGAFKPSFFSGTLQIGAGATGTILTINPPAGKKVRLTALATAVSTTEANISITTDTGAVVSGLTLSNTATSTVGHFCVSSNLGIGGSPSTNGIEYIESIAALTITKSGGNTVNAIFYSYAFGD